MHFRRLPEALRGRAILLHHFNPFSLRGVVLAWALFASGCGTFVAAFMFVGGVWVVLVVPRRISSVAMWFVRHRFIVPARGARAVRTSRVLIWGALRVLRVSKSIGCMFALSLA